MRARLQKRLAVGAAVAIIVAILAANAHLLWAAISSQPECVAVETTPAPAKPAC